MKTSFEAPIPAPDERGKQMDKNVYRAIAVSTLKEKNAYHLSSDAGCATPDTLTSEGARLLTGVRDSVVELIEGLDIDDWHEAADGHDIGSLDDRGAVSEIADGAPSIYTHTLWGQFVDLAAYNEDPTELGVEAGGIDADDLSRAAAMCLYIIADRLARSLLEEAAETYVDALVDIEEFEDA